MSSPGPADAPLADRWAAEGGDVLWRIGEALVSELDVERVVERLTEAATDLVGAEVGLFAHSPPSDSPLFAETFAGRVVRLDDVGLDLPAPLNLPDDVAIRSFLGVPVVARTGDVLGGLFFGHPGPGVFTARHERLIAGIAGPAAIALDNARLYQTAQREREEARRLAVRLAQVQAVGASLAGARTVDEVATVVVTGTAAAFNCDRSSLFVLGDDGGALRLVHSMGYEGRWADRWSTIDIDAEVPAADALRSRELVIVAGDDDWAARYPDAAGAPTRSRVLAVIPLVLGDHAFGVAAFGWDTDRRLGRDEVQFLESLAGQASQALERARLYETERETARVLQRSLLPPRTPEIPGMEIGAVFRPGDRSVAVGGDFYDVFPLGPNRWGIAMGDVCGRGALAASRTALLRYTTRALASTSTSPSEVLRKLNKTVLGEPEADDRFCATVHAHVELDTCGAWVTLACAGHPRPVVVRRAGWMDLRGQPGTIVGVFEDLDVTDDRVGLGPGDAMVFFTDGISEARNAAGEQFADEGLPEILLNNTEMDAGTMATRIPQAALDFTGGTLGDDLAVLVLRVPVEAADNPQGRLAAALGEDADKVVPHRPLPHGGMVTRARPPREARIILPPVAHSVRSARRFLSSLLISWRMPELLEGDAALLLSELATNAILHARSDFSVIVRYDGDTIRIEVGDGSQAEPTPGRLDPLDKPGGRGLVLIDAMASAWGILRTARGKRVWFELPVPTAVHATA